MSKTVERSTLDLRYQDHRLRDKAREARLLGSIAQRGIEQPLEGVGTPQGRILLNGFKRYRCAEKLSIESVPYLSLGDEEALGIAALMQSSKDKDLNILEQAKFVVELLTVQQMSIADVAELLCRSKSWVCVRKSLLEEMNEEVQQILLRDTFPVYSYMHTLRPLMRLTPFITCTVKACRCARSAACCVSATTRSAASSSNKARCRLRSGRIAS